MLSRGGNGSGACQAFRQAIALEAAHLGYGELRDDPRVFAGALSDPSPARIARDIEHGREGHTDAVGGCLDRRRAGARFPQARFEGSRFGERDWENGSMPMQNVEAGQKRKP